MAAAVQGGLGLAAPPAPAFEAQQAPAASSTNKYAAAVLAGLPEDDELVQLSRQAGEAGKSLEVRPRHARG